MTKDKKHRSKQTSPVRQSNAQSKETKHGVTLKEGEQERMFEKLNPAGWHTSITV